MQKTSQRTPTRLKFDGMVFIHTAKATPDNHDPMAYINAEGGIKYYRMKRGAEDTPDVLTEKDIEAGLVDRVVTIPTKEEIVALQRKDMIVSEDGSLQQVSPEEKPPVLEHHSGKKMKRKFLNPKTGNYVSYVRAIQLKLVKGS